MVVPNAAANTPVRLQSTWARAIVPVLAGLAFLTFIGLVTWGVAAWISRDGVEPTERLAPTTFPLGSVQERAADVAEEGPIILPGLNTTTGERTLVIDHQGADPTRGWRIYYAHPIGRPDCPVEQIIGTRDFVDCDGATITVEDLSPPDSGVNPIVQDQRRLLIDLRGITTG